MAAEVVTFALPSGVKVSCSVDLAKRLGYKPKPPAPKKSSK